MYYCHVVPPTTFHINIKILFYKLKAKVASGNELKR